jgi:hypothetical protein
MMRRITKVALAAGAVSMGFVGTGGVAAADDISVVDSEVFTATFVRNGEELACDVYGESEVLWIDDPTNQSQVFAYTYLQQPADPRCEEALVNVSAGGDYTGNPDGGVDWWMSYGADYASGTVGEHFKVTGLDALHSATFLCDDEGGHCFFQFTTKPK